MNLNQLIDVIRQTNDQIRQFGLQQVNAALTIRNWMIGFHIVEFEQEGEEKAIFGDKLISKLAKELKSPGLSTTTLKLSRQFYQTYPQFGQTVSDQFTRFGQTLSDQVQIPDNKNDTIRGTVSAMSKRVSAKLNTELPPFDSESITSLPPDMLLSRLSFSHFIELMQAETSLKRAFYEVQCIKNNWSVRELSRAMSTLLYRPGILSPNP